MQEMQPQLQIKKPAPQISNVTSIVKFGFNSKI
jgi:hypothetical protein